jgi:hypothetical protein
VKAVDRETIKRWYRLYERDGQEEVEHRNEALHLVYGRLPSYAYFSDESEFSEPDWADWWIAVLTS